MKKDRINYLFEQYYKGLLSGRELAEWEFLLSNAEDPVFDQITDELWQREDDTPGMEETEAAAVFEYIIKQPQPIHRPIWPRIAAAASIIIFLSIGSHFLLQKPQVETVVKNNISNDIVPGTNKAMLTLSNGKKISLSEAKFGYISKEGNKLINKTTEGAISYEDSGTSVEDKEPSYNTISTPRGGQWRVKLPDGTKVTLDAASSIKYPVTFADNERRVEISGQAYFEVIHDAGKPFRVITHNQTIEDIGTIFNINAYGDEPLTKTTLLEGAVRVFANTSASKGVILKPGQQASSNGAELKISNGDIEEVFAWKNGFFMMRDETLESVMRKLSRWYDIDVVYQGPIPERHFGGQILRNNNLSEILKVLEAAGLHFSVQGKKIIVMP